MNTMTFGESVALRVATADQQHTAQKMAAMLGPAALPGVKPHPWYQGLGETVIRRIADGTANLCSHLGPRRGVAPMYAVMSSGPLLIQCRCCFGTRQRLSSVDDRSCDRCSVYTRRGLICGVLPVGPLLLTFGVCRPCAVELGAVREQAASPS